MSTAEKFLRASGRYRPVEYTLVLNTLAVITFCIVDVSSFSRYKQEYAERWTVLRSHPAKATGDRLADDLNN